MLSKSRNKVDKKYYLLLCASVLFSSFIGLSCVDKQNQGPYGPPGYDLNKPEKYGMPDILQEISGIAFNKGDNKVVYAEMDEDGSLFTLPLGTKNELVSKFGKKGDYEDITIIKERAVLLKSNGDLYSFLLSDAKGATVNNVEETKNVIPKGEYEGMYGDEATGQVYVLCKNCGEDKGAKRSTGYILTLQGDGSFKSTGTFSVDVSQVDKMSGKKKGAFHASALGKNPLTNEWYIVSSVNKALVVTDEKWKMKAVYHLSSNVFNQPEGIAFDAAGNLYISNEGSETTLGNILRFDYKKTK